MAGRPFLAGHTVWSFTDYATEHRNRTRSQAGLFDAWRQPKMAAELFRARYSDQPFISLFCVQTRLGTPASPYRTEIASPLGSRSAQRLHVFSNCEGIRIHQGGALRASLESTPHTIIPIDLAQGEIVAEGYAAGRTVTSILMPPGEPHTIRISHANGRPAPGSIQTLDLRIVDGDGITSPPGTAMCTPPDPEERRFSPTTPPGRCSSPEARGGSMFGHHPRPWPPRSRPGPKVSKP